MTHPEDRIESLEAEAAKYRRSAETIHGQANEANAAGDAASYRYLTLLRGMCETRAMVYEVGAEVMRVVREP